MWDTIHAASHLVKRSKDVVDFSTYMMLDNGDQPPPLKGPSGAQLGIFALVVSFGIIFVGLVSYKSTVGPGIAA